MQGRLRPDRPLTRLVQLALPALAGRDVIGRIPVGLRNRRLYDAIDKRAFCAISVSPGARALYDQHRAAGDLHHQALRALGNRPVGILHGCLRHHTLCNEHTAWAHRTTAAA